MESYICLRGKKILIEDYQVDHVLAVLKRKGADQELIKEVIEELMINEILDKGMSEVLWDGESKDTQVIMWHVDDE